MGIPLVFLGGVVLLRDYSSKRHLLQAQKQWQSVSGEILESGVSYERAAKGYVYRNTVRYAYEVRGKRFEDHRITLFDTQTGWSSPQYEMAAKYPVQRKVNV